MDRSCGARIEIEPMRIYDYDIVLRAGGNVPKVQKEFPSEFIISQQHRGILKDQGDVGACVGCVISSLAEVLNIIEQEKDKDSDIDSIEFSEGWAYGALREKCDWNYGMLPTVALSEWSKKGIVPKKYFNILEEMPDMKRKTESINSLNKIAELYKIKGYASLTKRTAEETDKAIKQALMDSDYGLLAISKKYFYESHCIMIVGWNDKNNTYKIKNSWGEAWGDSEGVGEIPKYAIDAAYIVTDEILDINFSDVHKEDWFYKYVKNMSLAGIINGVTETTFEPNRNITRAEMVTIVSRLIDLTNNRKEAFLDVCAQLNERNYNDLKKQINKITNIDLPFTDVKKEDWFYEALKKVYNLNLIKGRTEKEFVPNDFMTRAEIVVLLDRLSKTIKDSFKVILKNINKSINNKEISKVFNYDYLNSLPFIDVERNSWYYEAILNLYTLNIISGKTYNTFEPEQNITRAETATIIDRFTKYFDSIIQIMLEN